jgi:type II secretory pathway component GspD/PulD (secretin)
MLSTLLALGADSLVHAQQTVLEVIDLKYRSAEQIVPILKALLAPGGTISALQNGLVVRTTPQNLAALRKVLDAVDTVPKRLMISVRRDAIGTGKASEAELSGSIGTGDARANVPDNGNRQGGTVVIRRGDSVARARVLNSQSAATDRGEQSVQVLEGDEAKIRVGQSIPVRGRSVIRTPQGQQVSETVEYRDAETGFRVRPRVNGDQVTLEISSHSDTLADPDSQAFNVQRVATVVTGRLGEWMDIGGVQQSRTQTDGGAISRSTGSMSSDRKMFLKVEMLP